MEETDFLHFKFSRGGSRSKSKFGNDLLCCGATLKRNRFEEINKARNQSVILKHVSITETQNIDEILEEMRLDDGGLTTHGYYLSSSKRGKCVRSVVAQRPLHQGWKRSSEIFYSMNKKKRWILPEKLKKEIRMKKNAIDGEEATAGVDLTYIEREAALYFSKHSRADTVTALSTLISEEEEFPSRKKRKKKSCFYGWSTDMLGLSQKLSKEDEVNQPIAKSGITYEVCHVRTRGPGKTYFRGCNFYQYPKNKRRKQKRNIQNMCKKPMEDAYSLFYGETDDNYDVVDEDLAENVSESHPIYLNSWIELDLRQGKTRANIPKKKNINKQAMAKPQIGPKPRTNIAIQQEETNDKETENSIKSNENFIEKITKIEESSGKIVNVSVQSLLEFNTLYDNNETEETVTVYGCTVKKSQSNPAQYAIEVQSCCTFSEKKATGYLILNVPNIARRCPASKYCDASEKVSTVEHFPIKIKLFILSEDDRHLGCLKSWIRKFEETIFNRLVANGSADLSTIIEIASESLTTCILDNKPRGCFETQSSSQLSALVSASYKREVIDKVSSMLGVSAKVLQEVENLPIPSSRTNNQTKHCSTDYSASNQCEICLVEFTSDEALEGRSLSNCNHWFCLDCWRNYLIATIQGTTFQILKCPAFDCTSVVDDVTLMSLLPGNIVCQYQSRKLKFSINRSSHFHHCPNCASIVEVTTNRHSKFLANALPISCKCGARWCSHCKEKPHWPATCAEAEVYRAELANLSAHKKFIKFVVGRRCPKCHEKIEKNGGCQMMTCVCGFMFCWKCLQYYGDCLYRCRNGIAELETWELSQKESTFVEAVFSAKEWREPFACFRIHRQRKTACFKAASDATSSMLKHENPTATDKINAAIAQNKILEDALLHCDALRYIIQYLTVSVGLKRGHHRSSQIRAKLKNRLKRIKLFVTWFENSIFEKRTNDDRQTSIKKKLIMSQQMIDCLIQYMYNNLLIRNK